jgi:integrase
MQQGQGFELKKRAVDGRAVWAYRYRTDGPGQTVTAGGFSSEGDAAEALDSPQRRRSEKRPFQSWAQLDELAARLGSRYRPPVLFAAATGLRPGEGTERP